MATTKQPIGPLRALAMAGWLGLAAGLLEVLTRVVCTSIGWHGRLHQMSRHFVWLVPLSNVLIFLSIGLFLAALVWVWPRFGRWLGVRWLGAMALLPALLVAFPEIYTAAWMILAWGVAVRLAPLVERRAALAYKAVTYSFPVLALAVLALAGSIFGSDWIKQNREAGRPFPPNGSPNVLLVVLDTVRADHLSVYGYERRTSPTLEQLADHGVRFDAARSTAPWTLASHASLFTGRLPHEMRVRFLSPIELQSPTLASYLGSRGYATAGFVANALYCGRETGLAEGFTHYEDYKLQGMDGFFMAGLAERSLIGTLLFFDQFRSVFHSDALAPLEWFVGKFIVQSDGFSPIRRKDAATINNEFLAWLSQRRQPGRPFFAFLNYFDAHTPYFPPRPRDYRFGLRVSSIADQNALVAWVILDKLNLPTRLKDLARDCYDDCIRSLDNELRRLFSALFERGMLDNTVVIVTADHGEGFGEHNLWVHAESLYLPELHVPLIMMTPRSRPASHVVSEAVSLIDVPATVVDLAGVKEGSPFRGRSLAHVWGGSPPEGPVVSELASPDPEDPNQGRSPARLGPLTSLEQGQFRYIHRATQEQEELYNVAADQNELHNLAGDEVMKPVLERFRSDLAQILGAK